MSKKHYKAPKNTTGKTITTKSAFGSDGSMVVAASKYGETALLDNQVICKDDDGFYVTAKNRIDDGLADPNRYSNSSARLPHGIDIS
jgi:hypothetical protein